MGVHAVSLGGCLGLGLGLGLANAALVVFN